MRQRITFIVEGVIAPTVLVSLFLAACAGGAIAAPLILYWLCAVLFNL